MERDRKKSSYSLTILDQSSNAYLIYHKNMFNDCIITSDIYSGQVMILFYQIKIFLMILKIIS